MIEQWVLSIAMMGTAVTVLLGGLALWRRASVSANAAVQAMVDLQQHGLEWLEKPENPTIFDHDAPDTVPITREKPYPIFDSWGDAQAWGEQWALAYPSDDPSPMPSRAPWLPKPEWEQAADHLSTELRKTGLSSADVVETHQFDVEVKTGRKRDVKPRVRKLINEMERYGEQLPDHYPIDLLRDHHPRAVLDDHGARTIMCSCDWASNVFYGTPVTAMFDRHLMQLQPVRRATPKAEMIMKEVTKMQQAAQRLAPADRPVLPDTPPCDRCTYTAIRSMRGVIDWQLSGEPCPDHCSTCFNLAQECPMHGWLYPIND